MSAGADATAMSLNASRGRIVHPPPSGPSQHGTPMQLPPDSQFCQACGRGWPVAVFLASNDGTRDITCLECLSPDAYAQYWEKLRAKMARRIRRTELKEPARQARRQVAHSMYADKAALAEKRYRENPTKDYWQQVLTYRRLAAESLLSNVAIAPQPPRTPRAPRPDRAPSIGPLSAPAGSAVVSQMVYHQPQVVYNHQWSTPTMRDAATQHSNAVAGPSSSKDRMANLAPTILRSIQEPLRSIIWLKINYTFSQPDSVSQNSVYAAYVQAISPGTALQSPADFDPHRQPVDANRPINYFPPAAMKGMEFVSSIPRIFTGVRLSKEGFVCASLRRKTEKERQELWGLIEPALRGSGADPVVRALLSTKGAPGLAALANARPTPQSSTSSAINPLLASRHRTAGPIVFAARGQTSSSGSNTPPVPETQLTAGSTIIDPTEQSVMSTSDNPLLPARHRLKRPRPLNIELRGDASPVASPQAATILTSGVTAANPSASPAPAIASPAAQPLTPAPHPMIANRTITPTTSTPTIPAKRKVMDMSSRSSSPSMPNLTLQKPSWATTAPVPDRDSPPDDNLDPFALRPPGSQSADLEDGSKPASGIVLRLLPGVIAAPASATPKDKKARRSLGTAIDDAIEIE